MSHFNVVFIITMFIHVDDNGSSQLNMPWKISASTHERIFYQRSSWKVTESADPSFCLVKFLIILFSNGPFDVPSCMRVMIYIYRWTGNMPSAKLPLARQKFSFISKHQFMFRLCSDETNTMIGINASLGLNNTFAAPATCPRTLQCWWMCIYSKQTLNAVSLRCLRAWRLWEGSSAAFRTKPFCNISFLQNHCIDENHIYSRVSRNHTSSLIANTIIAACSKMKWKRESNTLLVSCSIVTEELHPTLQFYFTHRNICTSNSSGEGFIFVLLKH